MPERPDERRVPRPRQRSGRIRARRSGSCGRRSSARCATSTSGCSTGRCCPRSPRSLAEERSLSPAQAHDRLAAIGFTDPVGALQHIASLTTGLSRGATIQRHLMPVMIRWFADGVDPDYGLLAFRRISERLGATPWFLRMLRDSSGAAESLTRVLSSSRYVGELMEWIPAAVRGVAGRPPTSAAPVERGSPGRGARDPVAPRLDRGRDALGARPPTARVAAHRNGRDPGHPADRGDRPRAHHRDGGDDPGDAAGCPPRSSPRRTPRSISR